MRELYRIDLEDHLNQNNHEENIAVQTSFLFYRYRKSVVDIFIKEVNLLLKKISKTFTKLDYSTILTITKYIEDNTDYDINNDFKKIIYLSFKQYISNIFELELKNDLLIKYNKNLNRDTLQLVEKYMIHKRYKFLLKILVENIQKSGYWKFFTDNLPIIFSLNYKNYTTLSINTLQFVSNIISSKTQIIDLQSIK